MLIGLATLSIRCQKWIFIFRNYQGLLLRGSPGRCVCYIKLSMVLSNLLWLCLVSLVKQWSSLDCSVAILITLCFLIPLKEERSCWIIGDDKEGDGQIELNLIGGMCKDGLGPWGHTAWAERNIRVPMCRETWLHGNMAYWYPVKINE